MIAALSVLHVIVCIFLIAVVLLQRGKGAEMGAVFGGGASSTVFGSRGAGNFLTKITTASAIVFMGTSLTLAYLGYQASDIQLFDTTEPFDVPIEGVPTLDEAAGTLEEVPAEAGGLVEIPMPDAAEDTNE